jgi:hypothetical protein
MQISVILNALFNNGYDNQIRPGIGGTPLDVEVNLSIRYTIKAARNRYLVLSFYFCMRPVSKKPPIHHFPPPHSYFI